MGVRIPPGLPFQKNNMWCKTKAKVFYDPFRPGIRKVRPGSLIVADLDFGIGEYYRWWVKKRFGLQLQHTAWKPHVTILDGKQPLNPKQMDKWKLHEGVLVDIDYSVDIEQHWKFWVLPVRSKQIQDIRKELGLPQKDNLHITIGRML